LYKPTIFIGSSKEGEAIAQKTKIYFNKTANCDIWSENFFDVNVAALDNLCKKLIGYDFAIFIGSKDDWLMSRKKLSDAMRDNVIFEYGLFTGAIGRQRTFFIIQNGAKVFSDLNGITLSFFDSDEQLKQCFEKINILITEEIGVSRISMLPSTASAISYYTNFIRPVCNDIRDKKDITIQDKCIHYEKAQLNIIIPSELKGDLNDYSKFYYDDNRLVEGIISSSSRKRPVFLSEPVNDVLQIFDVPTILNSSFVAIDLFIGKDYIGKKDDVELYRNREIQNFKNTLQRLIDEDPVARRYSKLLEEEK